MNKIRLLLQATLLLVFTLFQQVSAEEAIYTGYFNNKAVSGYDVVSYFTEGKPVEGSSKYTFEYQGADWYFSSSENLTLFKNNPQQYAPQYGGHCAWAMSKGKTAPGNVPYWTIYNEKLYLNYDQKVLDTWRTSKDEFIKKADLNWSKLDKEY